MELRTLESGREGGGGAELAGGGGGLARRRRRGVDLAGGLGADLDDGGLRSLAEGLDRVGAAQEGIFVVFIDLNVIRVLSMRSLELSL